MTGGVSVKYESWTCWFLANSYKGQYLVKLLGLSPVKKYQNKCVIFSMKPDEGYFLEKKNDVLPVQVF